MAKVNPLNDDIINVIQYASNAALKKGQTFVNTALLFDGIQRLFALKPEFKDLSAKLKTILGQYNIDSGKFNNAYGDLYPMSEELPKTVDTELEDDALNVYETLKIKAMTEKRQQTAEDLLLQLFVNNSYKLYLVFSRISDNMKSEYEAAVDANVAEEDLPPVGFDVNLFYADMRKLLAKVTVKEIQSLETDEMQKYLTNINKFVASRKDLKFVGMNREITALEVALAGRTKKSAVLVGPAGTGKTSLVWELANRINNADPSIPELLRGTVIYELHMDALVAGSQFRGQFEQRLKTILDAVSKLKNVILFIDEFHTIVKAGGSGGEESGGDSTGANIMKPYLSRGDIWVIGATTNDEFNAHVEKDKAVSRRFKKVLVQEPSKEETLEIMRGVLPVDCEFFNKDASEEIIDRIYTLSNQYNMSSANPDKALTMLESAFAYSKVCQAENREVTVDDMLKAVELEFGLTMSKTKAADTRKALKEKLYGQEKALDKVCDYLDMIDLNIVNPERPKAVLFLAGPTGTGKTETAKVIAKYFTGSDSNLVTVNCNTLTDQTGTTSLFGSNPGYVGYKPTSDFLAQVKQKPNCVVLFDEIEKAHPEVRQSLISLFDEGFVIDKAGNKISFRNTIILLTSNIGFGEVNHNGSGMMACQKTSESAITAINKKFSPEWLARVDDIIFYDRLTPKVIGALIERYRKQFAEYSEIDVPFTSKEIKHIKDNAQIETQGARNIEHAVKVAYGKAALAHISKEN